MEDKIFWSLIEFAWEAVGGKVKDRQKLAEGTLSARKVRALEGASDDVVAALTEELDKLTAEELLAFDRTLERKLHAIDRQDVHEYVDGSDDGFLYARGFIVAAGKGYYEAVNANPAVAKFDLECEEMCYVSWHLYQEKFGEMPPSGISRESCSNKAGWPDLD
jgi:hypothetical protein